MYEEEARELYEGLPPRNKLALRHSALVAWREEGLSERWGPAIESAVEEEDCSRQEVESLLRKMLVISAIADVIEDQRALSEETMPEGVDTAALVEAARKRIMLETYLFRPKLEVTEEEEEEE